jgi:hypothetical protein
MRAINIKSALIAATLAVGAFTATSIATTTSAQAHGFGIHFGGGFGHGFGWGHHWGHRFGWGGPYFGGYGGDDYEGGCVIRRFVDEDGDVVVRKVCY